MAWQIYASISVLTNSLANLLSRVIMKNKKSDPVKTAILFQFILGFFALAIATTLGTFRLPLFDISLLRFILSAFLWASSSFCLFQSLQYLSAGESTIINSSSSLVSIMLGILFLKEPLTFKLFLGVFLILFSIVIISYEKSNSFRSKKGVFFALLGALCAGIAVVNETVILKTYDSFSYTSIMSFLPGIILSIVFYRKSASLFTIRPEKGYITQMVILGFFYSIQAITYYLALENKAPISLLSPFFRTTVVITVLLAALFLNERKRLATTIFVSALTIIGVSLLK